MAGVQGFGLDGKCVEWYGGECVRLRLEPASRLSLESSSFEY